MQPAVEREAAGTRGPQRAEAADDREVLEELGLLHLPCGGLDLPEAVRDEARDDREDDHQQRGDAQLEAHQHRDAAEALDAGADGRQHVVGRGLLQMHSWLLKVCGQACKKHTRRYPAWFSLRIVTQRSHPCPNPSASSALPEACARSPITWLRCARRRSLSRPESRSSYSRSAAFRRTTRTRRESRRRRWWISRRASATPTASCWRRPNTTTPSPASSRTRSTGPRGRTEITHGTESRLR